MRFVRFRLTKRVSMQTKAFNGFFLSMYLQIQLIYITTVIQILLAVLIRIEMKKSLKQFEYISFYLKIKSYIVLYENFNETYYLK